LTPDLGSVADFDYTALDLSQVQIPLSFPDLHDASLSPFPPPASNFPTPSCTGATNTESSSASPVSTVDSSPSTLVPGLKLPTPTPSTASTTTPKPKGRPGRKPTKKRPRSSSPEEDDEEDPDVIDKRQRNNLAAKRYRQKKVDRIEELEGEVKEVSKERDELKLEVARKDAEIKALREILLLTPDLGSVADFDYTALDLSQVQIPLSFPDLHDASLSPFPPPASNFPTPSCTGATNTESSSASPVSTVNSSPSTLVPGLKLPTPTPSTASTTTPKPKGRPGRKPTKKRPRSSSPEEDDEEDPDVIDKRQRNNLAAKRYRQKKVDRIEELEGEVKEVSKERDELKLEVARKDAEIKALREMLEMVQRDRDRERDKGM